MTFPVSEVNAVFDKRFESNYLHVTVVLASIGPWKGFKPSKFLLFGINFSYNKISCH